MLHLLAVLCPQSAVCCMLCMSTGAKWSDLTIGVGHAKYSHNCLFRAKGYEAPEMDKSV